MSKQHTIFQEAAADPNPGLPDPPGDDREDGVEPSGSGIPKDKRPADPDPAELIHDVSLYLMFTIQYLDIMIPYKNQTS